MADVRPFFVTGSNAKIKLNGRTLAFCTDLSYSIQILHQTPKVLGMYEGSSVEPLGYSVSGSFTVVRYVKDIGSAVGGTKPHGIAINDAGNGAGNWGSSWGGNLGSRLIGAAGIGNDGRANEALDPSKFQSGTTFDIQVYQKAGKSSSVNKPSTARNVLDTISGILGGSRDIFDRTGAALGGTEDQKYEFVGIANIRNCRITQADFNLTKKGVATQRFNFVALYVDEDSFVADFSGTGQQF